ncbi:hypothetical protein Q7P36_007662 [Cladosporium allicinum]
MSVFDSKADDAPQKWLDIQLTFISVQPPSTLYYATIRHPLPPPCPPPLPSHQPTSDKTKQCLPPYHHQALYHHSPQNHHHHHHHQQQPPLPLPHNPPQRKFPTPLLRLQLADLSHEGSSIFLTHIHGHEDLAAQVQNVLNLLYSSASPEDLAARPQTRSVTFIIRDFPGVAYTTGTELDDDHKEIKISAEYIVKCAKGGSPGDKRHELLGVICHELVHCFQWTSQGTCPGGLIEGIADWVRLRAGLGAKHWRREAGGQWDGGYQKTGYFLEWLEGRFGGGFVAGLNACLKEGEWDGEKVFGECCRGEKVEGLWEVYRGELEGRKEKEGSGGGGEDGPANPVPTHPAKEI